ENNYSRTLTQAENGDTSGLNGALKNHWLHAHQRQRTAPRKQKRRTRTSREVNMFFQGTAQPAFFVRINFKEGNEIAVKHILGFGAQDVSEPASHARTEI